MRRLLSATAGVGLAAGLVAFGATSASAHVTIDANTSEAGSYAVLTFSVPHGCGTSATTALSIGVPEEFTNVTPTAHPSWDVEVLTEEVSAGDEDETMVEVPSEVVYTAHEPLPADIRDAVELSVLLPDTPGETIAFPVMQTCEEDESGWVEIAEDGQDGHDLEMPAPTITITDAPDHEDAGDPDTAADAGPEEAEAGAPADGEAGEAGAADSSAAAGDSAAAESSGAPAAVAWGALALGAGGLLLGALALVRARRA